MIDRSITDAAFGEIYLGGKSAKTARRVIVEDRIPYQKVRGHWLLKESDAESWRDAKTVTLQTPSIKDRLAEITGRVIARKKGTA